MLKVISEINSQVLSLNSEVKKSLFKICATLFVIYFSYPLIRATSTALFLETFNAKSSPLVWLYSIGMLSVAILGLNYLQKKFSIHKLYFGVVGFSLLFFGALSLLIFGGYDYFAYPLFVWKEVYIVIVVHMSLAYMNSILDFETAKVIYGPLGAVGSIGSVLGGQFTSYITKNFRVYSDTENLLLIGMLGAVIVFITGFVFYEKRELVLKKDEQKHKKDSPLKSIANIKEYVFYIAVLVAITQFVINLANFKFNLRLEEFVSGGLEKASYLGSIYSIMSGVSFVLHILIIPILFKLVKNSKVHYSIPIIYFVFFSFTLLGGGVGLFPVAAMFVLYKGFDYSLFSSAKEMLYFPLDAKQKYGVKYIVDMIVYRFAKGLVSFVLIFFQSMAFVDTMLAICLILWLLILVPLFKVQKTILNS